MTAFILWSFPLTAVLSGKSTFSQILACHHTPATHVTARCHKAAASNQDCIYLRSYRTPKNIISALTKGSNLSNLSLRTLDGAAMWFFFWLSVERSSVYCLTCTASCLTLCCSFCQANRQTSIHPASAVQYFNISNWHRMWTQNRLRTMLKSASNNIETQYPMTKSPKIGLIFKVLNNILMKFMQKL